MLDKLCLVMDIDETMVHYIEDTNNPYNGFTQDNQLFDDTDKLLHRPHLDVFFDYVKKYSPDNVFKSVSSSPRSPMSPGVPNDKSIVLGIWTYGTRSYAKKVVELLSERYGIAFEFVYSREDMKPGMYDKELEYILEHHGQELDIKKENIFLVDNCPSNIYHTKNLNNGILVTSFVGHNIDKRDNMFRQLIDVCNDLLYKRRLSEKHINKFTLNGVPTDIISIGKNGNKTWDSDNTCRLYEEEDSLFFGGGNRKTAKRYKRYTRRRNNKRQIYKTGRRN